MRALCRLISFAGEAIGHDADIRAFLRGPALAVDQWGFSSESADHKRREGQRTVASGFRIAQEHRKRISPALGT